MSIFRCPNCGAPDKRPDKPKVTHEHGYPKIVSTVYACGTVTHPDWKRYGKDWPIYGEECR